MALDPAETRGTTFDARLRAAQEALAARSQILVSAPIPQPVAAEAGKVRAFCSKFYRRMLIWIVAFAVAFYLPITEAGYAIFSAEWQKSVVDKSEFRDVFLAAVAMVVLSASDLVDNIIASAKGREDRLATASAWGLIVIYFLFVLYGMGTYARSAAPPDATAWSVVKWLLGLGILGEIIIANTDD